MATGRTAQDEFARQMLRIAKLLVKVFIPQRDLLHSIDRLENLNDREARRKAESDRRMRINRFAACQERRRRFVPAQALMEFRCFR